MTAAERDKGKRYKLYLCLDPTRNGILCEVDVDPGMVLGAVAERTVSELLTTHRQLLPGVTMAGIAEWFFLHGNMLGDVERLDPQRTLHDLAIFPNEIIYMGPAYCFDRWLS